MRLLPAALALIAVMASPLQGRAQGAGLEGVPAFSHVVVLILENEDFNTTWGAGSAAHYLNSLRPLGTFEDQYYAIGHVSLDNYIAMISGQPPNPLSSTDCLSQNLYQCVQPQKAFASGRNLADQLDDAGVSWKGYMDSTPSPCFHADYTVSAQPPDPYQGNSQTPPGGDYADRHNPFIYFPDIIENDARCKAHVVPYTTLAGDLSNGHLPGFAFITPDTCHDGHDSPCSNGKPGGLVSADLWLTQNIPPILDYVTRNNGTLIITFDEASTNDTSGCCTGGPGGAMGFGGRVGLLALGARTRPGVTVSTKYDHASLLRTVEDVFGISTYLNNAAGATPMADLFGPAATVPTPSPLPSMLANTGTAAGGPSEPLWWLPLLLGLGTLAALALRRFNRDLTPRLPRSR
jgi:phospholipase C